MSLFGLNRAVGYYQEQDRMQSQWENEQAKRRKAEVTGDTLETAAKELFDKVRGNVIKYVRRYHDDYSSVPLKTHPDCVIKRVIEMFAEKGVKARHVCNDGEPQIDCLEVKLSTLKIAL